MKILQLCIRVPYPPVDGGSIAMYNSGKALTGNGAVLKVLAFNTIKQYSKQEELPLQYKNETRIESVFLDNRVKPFAALLNLFSKDSYNIIRFIRRDFDELLIQTLKAEEFDIIQMESLFMIPYLETIRRYSKARIVFRTHNIEHLIWERMAHQETRRIRKWYLNLLCQRLRQYELWAINRADAIVAMTTDDVAVLKKLGADVPIYIAPVGINSNEYQSAVQPEANVLFHLGAMDWLPNQEGIRWFMDEVWPGIKSANKNITLKLAGKSMPPQFQKYADDRCTIQGFVPDAKAFMASGSVMIVPLLSGSGMRVKIIEGMAMGKAVVTTSVGAEGIPVTNGQNIIIADTAIEFQNAILHLINQPERITELGSRAKELAAYHFDNLNIGKRLLDFYAKLMLEKPVKKKLYES